jgi:hypothetical protein
MLSLFIPVCLLGTEPSKVDENGSFATIPQEQVEKGDVSFRNLTKLIGQSYLGVQEAFGNASLMTQNIMDNTVLWYKQFEVHFDTTGRVFMVSLNKKYKGKIFADIQMKKTGVRDLWATLSFNEKEDITGIKREKDEVTLEEKTWIYYYDLGLVFTFDSKDRLEVVEINENFSFDKLDEQLAKQKP